RLVLQSTENGLESKAMPSPVLPAQWLHQETHFDRISRCRANERKAHLQKGHVLLVVPDKHRSVCARDYKRHSLYRGSSRRFHPVKKLPSNRKQESARN